MAAPPRHSQREDDDNKRTKWWCQVGLLCSWFISLGSAVTGGICLYLELRDGQAVSFWTTHTMREVMPLILNIVVTLLNESMGYVHTCSLRWALQAEGKLDFNSNLRLFSFSRRNGPNAWYANVLFLVGILLAYSSTSLIFLSTNPQLARVLGYDVQKDLEEDRKRSSNETEVHINSIALLTFGFGLFAQAVVATWAFVTANETILTWSSNPLDVVYECIHNETIATFRTRTIPRRGRCMMPVHMHKEDRKNLVPLARQPPMFTAHNQVKAVFFLLWALPILGAIWGIVIHVLIMKGDKHGVMGQSWYFLPVFTGVASQSTCAVPAPQCTDGTSVLNIRWTSYSGPAGTAGSIALVTAFQAAVTISLHCAELLVNLARDESVYRQLYTSFRGTNAHYNSIVAACTSWQTITLFTFKAFVHWIFGLAINLSFLVGVNMYPPQIFYFTAFSLLVALFGTLLAFYKPRGPLPSSFGHIQTIADVVDRWSIGSMFWGHKLDGENGGPCFAGTSSESLPAVYKEREYGGSPRQSHQEIMSYNQGYRDGQRHASHQNILVPPDTNTSQDSGGNWGYRPSYSSLNSHYSYQSTAPLMGNHYP